jgi:hypothetical protein
MAEPKEQRHAWLDLLEVDGPFLSRPALDDVFDAAWPPKISNDHRDLFAPPDVRPTDWDEALPIVERLLTEVLGYQPGRTLSLQPGSPVRHPIHDKTTVTPYAVAHVSRRQDDPRMIVLAGRDASPTPDSLDPQATSDHMGWPSTPVQRAALAARSVGADIALVTNGHDHLIVWVGSGVTGYAWVDPSLYRLDRRLADGFVALMAAPTVTTVADTSTSDLLKLSQDKQVDVTEKLGLQVRRAAEALVNAVSRANRNTDGKLLAEIDPEAVYAGVVTVLMRTVFLLNAEERNLISSGDLWDRAYAVSTLLEQLDDDHYLHQGVMRRRHGAWLRLLAAARAVHGGVHHSQMNVPAYGGNLFDPTRHPFLEGTGVDGEVFDVGVVDDATLRHVLDLLQRLDGQRISYRAFSVEQIGQVYESLLDHSAVSVLEGDVVLGLVGTRGNEPEVSLDDLETQRAKGKLADWLAKEHDPSSGQGKKAKWEARTAKAPDDRVAATLGQACSGDAEILERVEPFAGLLRADARGVALVFLPGDVYVTETANRRDTGTAYTSPAFAAEIAHHALEHLVYEPGPHNEEDESHWQIKTPDQILELRVCDPAVGSGAILVAAVRYLADKLVESRLEHGELSARDLETAAADPTATDPHVQARRDVVAQCIYAVDRDPMAVEMAKLSLWLITMAHGRPFTFLDHALKCGDSLLGVTSLDQLRRLHLDASVDTQIGLDLVGGNAEGLGGYFTMIDERINQALALRDLVREGDVKDAADANYRADLNAKADRLLDDLRLVADAITAVCYVNAGGKSGSTESSLRDQVLPMAAELATRRDSLADLGRRRPSDAPESWDFLHWAVEFPEVLRDGGFSAIVGNPPFLGGKRIKTAAGENYRKHLVRYVVDGESRATTDLVAYFLRRSADLSRSFGLIATDSISQGDSRLVGLRALVGARGTIHRADSSVRWPGRDAVFVARVWWVAEPWDGLVVLDAKPVASIEGDLYPAGRVWGEPFLLKDHEPASVGVFMRGAGFVVSVETATELVASDPQSVEILVPYRNGDDINSTPDHSGQRMAIDFGRMAAEEAARYDAAFRHLSETVRDQRSKAEGRAKEVWWQYAGPKQALMRTLGEIDHAIIFVRHTAYPIPILMETGPLFSDACVVLPWDDWTLYGILTSEIHGVWVRRYSSTLGGTIRYSHTDTFATMPLPGKLRLADGSDRAGVVDSNTMSRDTEERLRNAMASLQAARATVMAEEGYGLTRFYGEFHDESSSRSTITGIRDHHVELDHAARDAYGWDDLDLGHGFHDTRYGRFFTVSTEARFELLMRLLQLNFEQAAEQTGRSLESIMREAQQHV